MTASGKRLRSAIVPGLVLEFTQLEQALNVLCMSYVDYIKLMVASPVWPFPAVLDGWKLCHDAIRYDLDVILAGLETAKSFLVRRVRPLAEWQVEGLQGMVRSLYLRVHQHLHHKRHTLFPWLATRVELPPKMTDFDQPTLLALLDRVRQLSEGLSTSDLATAAVVVRELHTAFVVLRTLLRQQMEREEVLGLPLLRRHFTAREAAAVDKKCIAQMRSAELAWLLRPLAEAEKRAALTRLGFPGLLQKLVLLPALRRADRAALRAQRELAAGERLCDAAASPPASPQPPPSQQRQRLTEA